MTQTFLETRILLLSPDVNIIQLRAWKIWKDVVLMLWENFNPPATNGALATASVQIIKF